MDLTRPMWKLVLTFTYRIPLWFLQHKLFLTIYNFSLRILSIFNMVWVPITLSILKFPTHLLCIDTNCANTCIQVKDENYTETREGFLRKNIVAASFFQNCAIHPYS